MRPVVSRPPTSLCGPASDQPGCASLVASHDIHAARGPNTRQRADVVASVHTRPSFTLAHLDRKSRAITRGQPYNPHS